MVYCLLYHFEILMVKILESFANVFSAKLLSMGLQGPRIG